MEVDFGDGISVTYRVQPNGAITDIVGSEVKNTNDMTIDQIVERAKQFGHKVKTYDEKQLEEYDRKRKADREETDRFLDHYDAKDRSRHYRAPRKGWKGH